MSCLTCQEVVVRVSESPLRCAGFHIPVGRVSGGLNRGNRRTCNLNQDLNPGVVERSPGERVAGMLDLLPIRCRALVCNATLRENAWA